MRNYLLDGGTWENGLTMFNKNFTQAESEVAAALRFRLASLITRDPAAV